MAEIPSDRLVVIPHGLSPEEAALGRLSRSGSKSHRRVLSIARLIPEHAYKGVDTLIACWPQVLQGIPNVELQIVGDGPDRVRLQSQAEELKLDGSVIFVGSLTDADLARAYAEADVFALPVRTTVGADAGGEGFGLVFLEAAAAGLPVVAGNGGAVPEVVVNGETGLLINGEDPSEVARAIIKMLRDPELAKRMGQMARARANEYFSFERFRDRLGGLIAGIQSGPGY